jgi:hypothetical protein
MIRPPRAWIDRLHISYFPRPVVAIRFFLDGRRESGTAIPAGEVQAIAADSGVLGLGGRRCEDAGHVTIIEIR